VLLQSAIEAVNDAITAVNRARQFAAEPGLYIEAQKTLTDLACQLEQDRFELIELDYLRPPY